MKSPLEISLSLSQMRNVANIITQHQATIQGVTVELKTIDGARVLVDHNGSMNWLRRDEII